MYYNKKIMDYLAKYEGGYIHFNKGEKSITSAYGIYKYANPKADIFSWYKQLRKANGIGKLSNKANRQALNKLIKDSKELSEIQKDLAWDFYVKNYMNPKVADLLPDYTILTYFSISVNGGKGRGAKALQYAIKKYSGKPIAIDGAVGRNTIKVLKSIATTGDFDGVEFNNLMVEYLKGFYKRLITKNPSKYKRFAKGWNNRANGLLA